MAQLALGSPPANDEQLWWAVRALWGVTIPRQQVCPDHVAPFTAFADAYFGRNSLDPDSTLQDIALWHGSRGLSGKSYMLAVLGLTKAVLRGCDVNLLGGSFEQSKNIHMHMRNSWDAPNSPAYMLVHDGAMEVRLSNKAKIHPLTASQRTVRGPHPPFLLLDEIDEMDLDILDAALGQPLPQVNWLGEIVKPYAVMCFAAGTQVLTEAGERPIETIAPGTRVWTRGGWRPVRRLWRNGHRPVIEVRLSNGRTLRCTADHRVAVPTGWVPAGELLPGQEVCGVRTGLVVGEQALGEQPLGSSGAVPLPGLLAVADPLAGLADPAPALGQPGVGRGELVPLAAVGLQAVALGRGVAAPLVLDAGDGFQVGRVAAGPVGAAALLDVVDLEPVGDGAHQVDVGPAVDAAAINGAVHVSVPLAPGPIPDPAAGLVDRAPTEEPVFVVGVRTEPLAHRAPLVYDLEVEDIHEYIAQGVTVSNCSTWQNPAGTFTEIMRRAESEGIPVYQWCYLETSNPVDGWLSQETIAAKKAMIPKAMWDSEYDLNEPSIGNRAFDTEAVDATFSLPFEPIRKKEAKDFEEYVFAEPDRHGEYVAAADWGREQDYTVIMVGRIDVTPHQLVYYMRVNRRPYPQMIGWFNTAINDYSANAVHDATGLGNVVNDYVDIRARKFIMTGEKRSNMLSEYVSAVESGKWVYPKVKSCYLEHKYARVGDLYNRGLDFHLPDSCCAGGLMHYLAQRSAFSVTPLVVPRDPSPTKLQATFARPAPVERSELSPAAPPAEREISFVVGAS